MPRAPLVFLHSTPVDLMISRKTTDSFARSRPVKTSLTAKVAYYFMQKSLNKAVYITASVVYGWAEALTEVKSPFGVYFALRDGRNDEPTKLLIESRVPSSLSLTPPDVQKGILPLLLFIARLVNPSVVLREVTVDYIKETRNERKSHSNAGLFDGCQLLSGNRESSRDRDAEQDKPNKYLQILGRITPIPIGLRAAR